MERMNAAINSGNDRESEERSIEGFLANSVIFVTGATGYLGKAIVEKLLHSCSRISAIYILIRPKKNVSIEQRFKHLLENSLFDEIRKKDPGILSKIHLIKGDITLPDLGLSSSDKNLLIERVNIVFHVAATVKFNEPLKKAIITNTKSPLYILELCKSMKNLISCVYISTAYSNPNISMIEETIYDINIKPSTIIDMCNSLNDELINVVESKILETFPNTYIFTKNLAEKIIKINGAGLPIAIVRPSIIFSAIKHPFPGWVDNSIQGITDLTIGACRGIIRVINGNKNNKANIVPIDYVTDTIICVAWHTTLQCDNTIKIYNCTNNGNSLTWDKYSSSIIKFSRKLLFKTMVWYPNVILVNNKYIFKILIFFLHTLPAFAYDVFAKLLGNKIRILKYVMHMNYKLHLLKYFLLNDLKFQNDNMIELQKNVKTLKDCDNFIIDIKNLDWDKYIEKCVLILNTHNLSESKHSLTSRSRLVILYWIKQIAELSLITLLLIFVLYILQF
ncbi:putative fatty acyl-CoA reductase CG5065 [Apis florea]|uniref:putative fatty acyl-CoA reductase CG5065 n=1 Tax=Apis florea TaxID=7463 RepID=UPI0006292DD5|nr:putative fatty acyl-CoA reductase CG5065 [Apis florea]XP_031773356.1 putative fatty acyl-CoA reductase CG5065 [Apis florea]XP_031773357.1 putative fatty acyl-CoA reductase CG5065 [Apis florea]XP_031773358.1 putative fatty acyl-CoA reductase CG5065 [Apis florea]XP_031773359.1 putative fatty acyl-CoA reductase CG5065 [Apis florea]